MTSIEAPCGVKVDNIVSATNAQLSPYICPAIRLTPASGIKYTNELGLSNEQRTQKVGHIYDNKCDELVYNDQCPTGFSLQ